jgi:polysaccharide export outer membrane protein
MKRMSLLRILIYSVLTTNVILNYSCTSSKKIVYFQEISENQKDIDSVISSQHLEIGDVIQIAVTSSEPNDYSHFSKSGFKLTSDQADQDAYLIDSSGKIDLPYVGSIEAIGKTTIQIKNELKEKLAPYLSKNTVNVRVVNLRITVIGDVAKPGTYQLNDYKISIPEALGLAGDLNLGARRDNILIISKTNGKRIYKRIDLRSNSSLNSYSYYLKSGDIIYVEPSKTKIAQNDTRRWQTMTFAATALSLLTIILLRL